jgi:hypothetical protein
MTKKPPKPKQPKLPAILDQSNTTPGWLTSDGEVLTRLFPSLDAQARNKLWLQLGVGGGERVTHPAAKTIKESVYVAWCQGYSKAAQTTSNAGQDLNNSDRMGTAATDQGIPKPVGLTLQWFNDFTARTSLAELAGLSGVVGTAAGRVKLVKELQ